MKSPLFIKDCTLEQINYYRKKLFQVYSENRDNIPEYINLSKDECTALSKNNNYYGIYIRLWNGISFYNEKRIGFVSIKNNDNSIIIYDLFISEEYRNIGYGSEVLEYIVSLFNGDKKILSKTYLFSGYRLLIKLGFEMIEIEKDGSLIMQYNRRIYAEFL